jgi:hypothetical protein
MAKVPFGCQRSGPRVRLLVLLAATMITGQFGHASTAVGLDRESATGRSSIDVANQSSHMLGQLYALRHNVSNLPALNALRLLLRQRTAEKIRGLTESYLARQKEARTAAAALLAADTADAARVEAFVNGAIRDSHVIMGGLRGLAATLANSNSRVATVLTCLQRVDDYCGALITELQQGHQRAQRTRDELSTSPEFQSLSQEKQTYMREVLLLLFKHLDTEARFIFRANTAYKNLQRSR